MASSGGLVSNIQAGDQKQVSSNIGCKASGGSVIYATDSIHQSALITVIGGLPIIVYAIIIILLLLRFCALCDKCIVVGWIYIRR